MYFSEIENLKIELEPSISCVSSAQQDILIIKDLKFIVEASNQFGRIVQITILGLLGHQRGQLNKALIDGQRDHFEGCLLLNDLE